MLNGTRTDKNVQAALDSSATTIERLAVVRKKRFLNAIYRQWYQMLCARLAQCRGPVLEIGSGAGFLREFIADLVTSDVLELPHVDHVFDACERFPFADQSLGGIAFVNTLHHLPDCRRFFQEAARCLRPAGVITMIEPWSTPWSDLIYANLHHEPYDKLTEDWTFQSDGPLSSANGALPWMLFCRDRERFEREFAQFEIAEVRPFMPLKYLLSGGFSAPALVPGWSFSFFTAIEDSLQPFSSALAMFAQITLVLKEERALESGPHVDSDGGKGKS